MIAKGTMVEIAMKAPQMKAMGVPCPVIPTTIPVSTITPEPMIWPIHRPSTSENVSIWDFSFLAIVVSS